MDFDEILENVGPFGLFQIYHFILIGIGVLPVGMNNVANVFVAATPEYVCDISSLPISQTSEFLAAIKPNIDGIQCKSYAENYTEILISNGFNFTDPILIANGTGISVCKKWRYDYDVYGRTIVSKWNLVCDDAFMKSLASSFYMFGYLIGAILLSSISDRFGRKFSWTVSTALLAVSGLAAAFVPYYWAHVILRFLSGCGASGSYSSGYVLCMEMFGKGSRRTLFGIFFTYWFACGFMILAGLAYLLRDYRNLLLAISVIPALLCLGQCFLSESPRWLLTKQRIDKCEKVLKKATSMNKTAYPPSMLIAVGNRLAEQQNENKTSQYSFLDLVGTPNMRKISLITFCNWFAYGLNYYGLTLGVSNLVGSPYLNLVIFGIMEFPAFCICTFSLNKIGRSWSLAITMTWSGLSCLCTVLLPDDTETARTILTMLGRFWMSGVCSILYVYSVELFPTVVRGKGVGASSMLARLGSLIAPFVADAGGATFSGLPCLVFGFCAVLAGLLAVLLPETLNKPLPETLEDGNKLGRNSLHCCFKSSKVSTINHGSVNNIHETSYI